MALHWHRIFPSGKIEDDSGKLVFIPASYLEAAASELRRYYADCVKTGKAAFYRPVLPRPHLDEGRRTGQIVDAAQRNGILLLKIKWGAKSAKALKDGSLLTGSVRIIPQYKDPQTGVVYSPFIDEYSETTKPKVKDFDLTPLTPSELKQLSLSLSEGKIMTLEELAAMVQEMQTNQATLMETLAGVVERLTALEGEGTTEGDGEDTAGDVSASEAPGEPQWALDLKASMEATRKSNERLLAVAKLPKQSQAVASVVSASQGEAKAPLAFADFEKVYTAANPKAKTIEVIEAHKAASLTV